MRLLDRIGSAWSALRRKSAPPAGSYSYGWGGGSSWSDAFKFRRAPSPAELVESYKSLVYACVNLNANAVARTPLRLYAITKSGQSRPKCAVKGIGRKTNERLGRLSYATKAMAGAEHVEEVTSHALLDAVMRVSEDLDHTQLITYTVMSLDIVGSAYWWPAMGRYQVPEELWALPPHLVYPVFTSGTMVPDAYNFGGVMYDRRDLVRFRRLSAKNPYGQGYGPEQAAIEYARLEDTFVSIQDNLLSNGPRPSLLVSHKDPKGTFGAAERQRLENEMERRGRGGRAGGVFVVDGAATVAPLSYTPTDLGALEVSSYDLERIANCFDVPVSMLKTEDVNRANAEAGLEQHGRNAVEPRCKLIASTLTRWTHSLDPKGVRGWDRLFWAFDPVVAEDRQVEAELHKTYLDLGVISRNEVRTEIGFEPVDGGDAILVPKTLARLDDVAAKSDSNDEARAEDEPDQDDASGVGGDESQKDYPRPFDFEASPEGFAAYLTSGGRISDFVEFVKAHHWCRDEHGRFTPCGAAFAGKKGEYRLGQHGKMPRPRPGRNSHHGVMSRWMKAYFPNYHPNKAPAILMSEAAHRKTYGIYNSWRAKEKKLAKGKFRWKKISEEKIKALAEDMFDAAGVPAKMRKDYWVSYGQMKAALKRDSKKRYQPTGGAMAAAKKILTAEEMKKRYGSFYDKIPWLPEEEKDQRKPLDPSRIPESLHVLIPYAHFWGISDDCYREELIEMAPRGILKNLHDAVSSLSEELYEWLGGPEAAHPPFSDEYIAFSAMGMAADDWGD